MELAFATLHQLCMPLLGWLERLPGPQRDALATTFGLSEGTVPDRFFVGLAMLGLLSEAAEERPLVCVVDDAQWLDRASARVLAFVGRRLLAEPVVMLFGAREPSEEFAGLPELVVDGLGDADARALLASVIPGRLDERVADQIVAETRGNPLALLELPRGLSAAQLAGGFGLPGAVSLEGRIEESFQRRLEALPKDTRRLLLVAAAEPTGDPALLWRAATILGITGPALEPAKRAGLLEIDGRVRFRHPLVRSAVYGSASPHERREVHRALAEATAASRPRPARMAPGQGDRRPRRGRRCRARAGGRPRPGAGRSGRRRRVPRTRRRTDSRALVPRATRAGGGADQVRSGRARRCARSPRHRRAGPARRAPRARGCICCAHRSRSPPRRGSDAPPLLLEAAREFEPIDPSLARATYLEAFSAALFAGRLARGRGVVEVAEAVRAGPPPPQDPRPPDLLLTGWRSGSPRATRPEPRS